MDDADESVFTLLDCTRIAAKGSRTDDELELGGVSAIVVFVCAPE